MKKFITFILLLFFIGATIGAMLNDRQTSETIETTNQLANEYAEYLETIEE